MRADHAVRHNAAVGALIGLAVGDALSSMSSYPPPVCGGEVALPDWGSAAESSFVTAERHLRDEPLDMALGAVDIAAAAIALAEPGASPPLLGDPDAALMCALVRDALAGSFRLDDAVATAHEMDEAIRSVCASSGFCEAIERSPAEALPLTGTLAGLRWGVGAIPATWTTTLRGPVGSRTYGVRQLRRLAERLRKEDAPVPPEPRRSLGPVEVAPKLWLSNLHAVPRFLASHPDGAVISLCPTTGAFDDHRPRREFALHDAAGSTVNPHLSATVDDVLATIAAFHAEDRDVLVHCHHGASRTGLILRTWLVENLDLTVDDATTEAQVRWPKTSTWNKAFSAEVQRRARKNL